MLFKSIRFAPLDLSTEVITAKDSDPAQLNREDNRPLLPMEASSPRLLLTHKKDLKEATCKEFHECEPLEGGRLSIPRYVISTRRYKAIKNGFVEFMKPDSFSKFMEKQLSGENKRVY